MVLPTLYVYGRTPNLSAAELAAVYRRERGRLPDAHTGPAGLVVREPLGKPVEVIRTLGGTVKIASILKTGRWADLDALGVEVAKVIGDATTGDRRIFGISIVPEQHLNRIRRLGMTAKRLLLKQGIHARFVTSERQPLSSVIVQREGLLEDNGAEIIIGESNDQTFLARTVAVQPFEELSKRDYGRPSRDVIAGMLPPKLAMMLINLSGLNHDQTLLDPFCGSGTVLQEAELLGFRRLIGSDASEEAIAATRENMKWLLEHADIDKTNIELAIRHAPFTELPRLLGEQSVDGIVTEPFLGPPLRRTTHPGVIKKAVQETSLLYNKFFWTALQLLRPGGVLVTIIPMFRTGKQSFREPFLKLEGFRSAELLPSVWGFDRRLIYGRPDQHIFRKILVLRKK